MGTNQVVAPILMQRQCNVQEDMAKEEWAKIIADRLAGEQVGYLGCGTWFQWYWGMNCLCPKCGRLWMVKMEDMNRFRVQENLNRIDERAIEDRILTNVLMRIGR